MKVFEMEYYKAKEKAWKKLETAVKDHTMRIEVNEIIRIYAMQSPSNLCKSLKTYVYSIDICTTLTHYSYCINKLLFINKQITHFVIGT